MKRYQVRCTLKVDISYIVEAESEEAAGEAIVFPMTDADDSGEVLRMEGAERRSVRFHADDAVPDFYEASEVTG